MKECGTKFPWPNLRYYPGIGLKVLGKTIGTLRIPGFESGTSGISQDCHLDVQ
jgi:hypothetical protein